MNNKKWIIGGYIVLLAVIIGMGTWIYYVNCERFAIVHIKAENTALRGMVRDQSRLIDMKDKLIAQLIERAERKAVK